MESKDRMKVPMLEKAEQWATWEYKVGIALKAGDVYNMVKGTETKPEVGAEDYEKKLTEWEKKDFKAQRIITETISEEFTIHLLACATSKDIWDKLHLIFEQQGETNKHALQQKFFSFQRDPNDNIATHISKVNKLVLQLRNAGVNIDESMVITRIITTLPSKYRHFGSSWDATAAADRTLQNLTNRLLGEELRASSMDPSEPNEIKETAFLSREKPKRKPGKCFNCGRRGHWKNECREKESKSANLAEAQTLLAANDVLLICEDDDDGDSFVLDSAATKHMCYKREWFSSYVELQRPKSITIGNGEKIYALGYGNISIQSFNGQQWINATLHGVLYIPKLHRNLFSSLQAVDKGCKVYTDRNKCEVTQNRSIVAVGARNGKLYHMQFKVKQPEKRKFVLVDIDDDDSIEANAGMATSKNIASKAAEQNKSAEKFSLQPSDNIVPHVESNDASSSTSSVYTTASEHDEQKSEESTGEASNVNISGNTTNAEAGKIDTGKSDDGLSKHSDKQTKSVLQRHQLKPGTVKNRRQSTVCDVMKENIIDSRLRGVKETNNERSDDNEDETADTAMLAIVDKSKTKKKRYRHKFIKKNHK